MAARIEAAPPKFAPEIVDLRGVPAERLDPLLAEETETWREALCWDFSKSAELVRRFLDLRALNGCALVRGGEVAGYAYYVLEDHKGLIGDLFVRPRFHSAESEARLLETVLDAIIRSSHVRRIESQLMMLRSGREIQMPAARFLKTYQRNFMLLDLQPGGLPAPARPLRRLCYFERWSEHYQESAAQLIASAYEGHVDGEINDQYRSLGGARRFLYNIVQYPGCGAFFRRGSCAAFDGDTGRICGMCLVSVVSPECGHITQICVAPAVRGTGIGYELLRRSLAALYECGCRKASLTVTASNRQAVTLYESVGFRTVRAFSAYVWEGF